MNNNNIHNNISMFHNTNIPMLTMSRVYDDNRLKYIRGKNNVLQMIMKYYPQGNWNFEALSENPNVSWDIVEYHINKRWNWSKLSRNNPHITCEILQKFINFWNWDELSRNSYISWEMIQKTINRPWNWTELSYNKAIKYVENIINDGIRNPKLNIEFIKNNPTLDWNWNILSQHPELTFDIVKMFIDKPWNWQTLSGHPNLTNSIVKKNINLPWCWQRMAGNNNIDLFELQKQFPENRSISEYCTEKNPLIPFEVVVHTIEDIRNRKPITITMTTGRFRGASVTYEEDFRLFFNDLSSNLFLYNDSACSRSMLKDNFVNLILALETIDSRCKLPERAENIKCKTGICDYNVVTIIKDMLL